jgi:hypothetical protein
MSLLDILFRILLLHPLRKTKKKKVEEPISLPPEYTKKQKKLKPKYTLISINNPLSGNLHTERGLIYSGEPGNIETMEKFISILKNIKWDDEFFEPVGILFKNKED